MEQPGRLRAALATAIEAGDAAATATRRIALGNREPDETGTGIHRAIARWSGTVSAPAVTASQVERACRTLDEFSAALAALDEQIAAPDERIAPPIDWTARLRGSVRAAADVHNEVVATLALLGRYRTNIVLGRPLLGGRPGD